MIAAQRPLVIAGRREELVSSGASTSWHDLVLYLFARYIGASAAQQVARMFALQWHQDRLAPGAYRRRFCIPGFACPVREHG